MIGNIKWNLYAALFSMSITFIFSIMHNVFVTALLGSVYSFFVLFLLVFLLRWMLGTLAHLQHDPSGNSPNRQQEGDTTGINVDIATPEDENLNELLKQQLSSRNDEQVFQPLNPKKFVSKEDPDPSHLADVIRNLSKD